MKKLYKSNTNKVLSGVIGGLGEYWETDPTVLRLGYVIIAVLTGIFPAIVAYIIAVIIVPEKPLVHTATYTEKPTEPKTETS